MIISVIFISLLISSTISINVPSSIGEEMNKLACMNSIANNNVAVSQSVCDPERITHTDWTNRIKYDLSIPKLYCRQEKSLTLQVDNDKLIYFFELKSQDVDWKLIKISNDSLPVINNLQENTTYKIRVWGLNNFTDVLGPSETEWFTTLTSNHMPQVARDLRVKEFIIENEFTAVINWNLSTDLSCYYEFVWFGGDDISDYTQKEIRKPSDLFELKIKNLAFESNYSIAIITKSDNWQRESEKVWLHFTTASCLQFYPDLNYCVPDKPTITALDEEMSSGSQEFGPKHNIYLTWKEPEFKPQYYTAHFIAFQSYSNDSQIFVNITGDESKLEFKNVDLGMHYQISLYAWSQKGRSIPAVVNRLVTSRTLYQPYFNNNRIFFYIFVPLLIIAILILLIMFLYYNRIKKTQGVKRHKYLEELELTDVYSDKVIPRIILNDELEIKSEHLVLQSVLGQGAFGIVRKGWLMQEKEATEVAVKMLKELPMIEEIRQFEQEIEIMKSVSKHPNIVSMIGWCRKINGQGPCLVVEYCAMGDLLTYLRAEWDLLNNESDEIQYADLISSESPSKNFSNMLYLMEPSTMRTPKIQVKTLLSMGRQVALGMEYLAKMRVLHRDLAARNVLLSEDMTIKVSDFGLSRDVYKDNVYCKKGAGKLPIRWMAIESLTHQRYTLQSDVWSFGILLWEIVTLGSNPYPGISTHELLPLIKEGLRMERPINCNDELYALMLNCWKANPKDRPAFIEIRKYLDNMLQNTSDYLNLEVATHSESDPIHIKPRKYKSSSASSERYVKPVILNK